LINQISLCACFEYVFDGLGTALKPSAPAKSTVSSNSSSSSSSSGTSGAPKEEKKSATSSGGHGHGGGGAGDDQNDFPHLMFLFKYMCYDKKCGGTMAPLQLTSSNVTVQGKPAPVPLTAAARSSTIKVGHECNLCGRIRTPDQWQAELARDIEGNILTC
jgi:hypothetical protein